MTAARLTAAFLGAAAGAAAVVLVILLLRDAVA